MVLLSLVTVGTLKERYLTEAFSEYKKRLSAFFRIEEINLKEEKIMNEDNRSEIEAALRKEGDAILSRLSRDSYKIVLAVEGDMPSSEELAGKLEKAIDEKGKITVIIGSSYGLSPAVKAAADYRLSLSRLTLPHQLARIVTAETLYRSMTILSGKRYHK